MTHDFPGFEHGGRDSVIAHREEIVSLALDDTTLLLTAQGPPSDYERARRNFYVCDYVLARTMDAPDATSVERITLETEQLMRAGAAICHAALPEIRVLDASAWRRRYRELFSAIRTRGNVSGNPDTFDLIVALHQPDGAYYHDLRRRVS